MEDILNRLNSIRQIEQQYNTDLPNSINTEAVEKFKNDFIDFFGIEITEEYLDFLKISNGLDFNGYQIYSSFNHTENNVEYGIFENNEVWYEKYDLEKNFIFFAESGSDLFVFNMDMKEHQLLDRYSADTYEKFSSFNNMPLYILKLMLIEEE